MFGMTTFWKNYLVPNFFFFEGGGSKNFWVDFFFSAISFDRKEFWVRICFGLKSAEENLSNFFS